MAPPRVKASTAGYPLRTPAISYSGKSIYISLPDFPAAFLTGLGKEIENQ